MTDHWTTFVEYDHLDFDDSTVAFPTVALVSGKTIGVGQSIDMVKLGVNYELPLAALATAQ